MMLMCKEWPDWCPKRPSSARQSPPPWAVIDRQKRRPSTIGFPRATSVPATRQSQGVYSDNKVTISFNSQHLSLNLLPNDWREVSSNWKNPLFKGKFPSKPPKIFSPKNSFYKRQNVPKSPFLSFLYQFPGPIFCENIQPARQHQQATVLNCALNISSLGELTGERKLEDMNSTEDELSQNSEGRPFHPLQHIHLHKISKEQNISFVVLIFLLFLFDRKSSGIGLL